MQNLPRLSLTFSAGQAYALTAQCPSGGMDAIAPWLLKFSSITLLKYKLGQNFLKIPTIIHLNEKKKKKNSHHFYSLMPLVHHLNKEI